MVCYKDKTFCSAASTCKNAIGCFRHLDKTERAKADVWAVQMGMVEEDGTPAPWFAWSDFSKRCLSYEEVKTK